jgi:hypothetical protein
MRRPSVQGDLPAGREASAPEAIAAPKRRYRYQPRKSLILAISAGRHEVVDTKVTADAAECPFFVILADAILDDVC